MNAPHTTKAPTIKVNPNTRCRVCNKVIPEGTEAHYDPVEGAKHIDCDPQDPFGYWDASRSALWLGEVTTPRRCEGVGGWCDAVRFCVYGPHGYWASLYGGAGEWAYGAAAV